MMRGRVATAPVLAAVAFVICLAPCAAQTTSTGTHSQQRHAITTPRNGGSANQAFEREMDSSMQRMMTDMHSPRYTGNVDIDFLSMMIPHHAGAVDMARLVLEHGRDPATRQLAEEIIASQTIEIESMQRRLQMLRRANAELGVERFPALGGTRGP